MEAAKKRLGWTILGLSVVALACAAAFSAYLRPDMLVTFGDVMAFCVGLIK